jgi:uncharacterized membrane protein YeiH
MFEVAEYIGIVAFAMSGFFVAVRAKLDFLGVLISVFLTAFGGGIVRDVIVDKTPYTFTHTMPGVIVLGMMILLLLLKVHQRKGIEERFIFIASDSIGLVSFSITGALIALGAGFNLTGVLALSFVTAVGGGIIRDIIINEVPLVFKTGFYGTVALFVGLCMYILYLVGLEHHSLALGVLFVLGVTLRLTAYYKRWSIPLQQ